VDTIAPRRAVFAFLEREYRGRKKVDPVPAKSHVSKLKQTLTHSIYEYTTAFKVP